jgi:hypothetical protein
MSDLQQFFGGAFDSTSVPPADDFPVLPPDNYPVLIESTEVKATKANDGAYVKIKMSVLDGPFKGRKLFDNINIHNPNQQCVEIGLRSLAALGQALGVRHVNDTDQFVNQVCVAHVKVKDGQNVIRTYSALTPAAAPGIPQQPQPPYQQPQQQPPYQQPQATYQQPPQQAPFYQQPASPAPGTYPPQNGGFAPTQYNQPLPPQQNTPPAGNKPPWMR